MKTIDDVNRELENGTCGDELLQQLYYNKIQARGTGRTYRLANDIIDRFFTEPMGTRICICDHYAGRRSDTMLARMIKNRLENDFRNIDFEIINGHDYIYIIRKSKTYQEKLKEEIDARTDMYMENCNKPHKLPDISNDNYF